MVFSSVLFLFYFLPLVFVSYFALAWSRTLRNLVLLVFSLIFYAWGEGEYIVILLLSIVANYAFGMLLSISKRRQLWVILSVVFNIGLLGFYKYANFFVDNLNILLGSAGIEPIAIEPVHLPIGISFFTFQALSYVIDVYRGKTEVQRNAFYLGLYIALFPQLIAGPIVRYADIAHQIVFRRLTRENISLGLQRFVIGLAKKVIIADQMSLIADTVFRQPVETISTPVAWIGIIAYTLQIFFDFSGYSDMAIGLGRVFGFTFLENFNFPYISQSIQEFWRRWHISLSSWFRDYLYIPLGGNRKGVQRTYLNLYIVFFLTGLWHGASWNFVVWGLWHGTFLVIERIGFIKLLDKSWQPLRHIYVMFVVVIGWVMFRAEDLTYAMQYIRSMLIPTVNESILTVPIIMNNRLWLLMILGIILSTPIFKSTYRYLSSRNLHSKTLLDDIWIPVTNLVGSTLLLMISIVMLVSSVSSPFIYFRF